MSLQVGKAIYNLLSNDANVTGRVQNMNYLWKNLTNEGK